MLVGDNAQGKTNLLEAIYYLATSRSPHAGAEREVVNWLATETEPLPYARLVGHVERVARELRIEITLTQQPNNAKDEQPTDAARYRKQIQLNGVTRRAMDLLGHLNVVLFLPDDIELVSGSPSLRRRYVDVTLCQIDPVYCRALSRYNQVVTQRNALLRDLRERGGDTSQLQFWDGRLVEKGAQLVTRRSHVIKVLDDLARQVHSELTDGTEQLGVRYVSSVEVEDAVEVKTVSASFFGQLAALQGREIAAGMTLVGPHRDEIRFAINDMDAGIYGSRGQQRTIALSMKLAEVELMRSDTGEQPVLLLDDVLSELDAQRRRLLLDRLSDGPDQVVLTTTDLHPLSSDFLSQCQLWRVELGNLTEV